jgi:hypothetical protein
MYVGPLRFAVRHLVSAAQPALLAAPFLIAPSASPYDAERLVGVATLEELITGKSTRVTLDPGQSLTYCPLDLFVPSGGTIAGAVAGDTLVIQDTPFEWGDGGTTTRTVSAAVLVPGGEGRLCVRVTEPFWWQYNSPATFTLTHAGASSPYHTGTYWETARSNGPDSAGTFPCLDSRFQAMFQEGETALNHMVSIETYLNALVKNSGLDGTRYEQYGINPVEIDLPE